LSRQNPALKRQQYSLGGGKSWIQGEQRMHAKPIKLFTFVELALLSLPAFLALCHDGIFSRRMAAPVVPTAVLTTLASASERMS
jgi:hypothetical protein